VSGASFRALPAGRGSFSGVSRLVRGGRDYFQGLDEVLPLEAWIAALEDLLAQDPSFPNAEIEARVTVFLYGALVLLKRPEAIACWEGRAVSLTEGGNSGGLRFAVDTFRSLHNLWTVITNETAGSWRTCGQGRKCPALRPGSDSPEMLGSPALGGHG